MLWFQNYLWTELEGEWAVLRIIVQCCLTSFTPHVTFFHFHYASCHWFIFTKLQNIVYSHSRFTQYKRCSSMVLFWYFNGGVLIWTTDAQVDRSTRQCQRLGTVSVYTHCICLLWSVCNLTLKFNVRLIIYLNIIDSFD